MSDDDCFLELRNHAHTQWGFDAMSTLSIALRDQNQRQWGIYNDGQVKPTSGSDRVKYNKQSHAEKHSKNYGIT